MFSIEFEKNSSVLKPVKEFFRRGGWVKIISPTIGGAAAGFYVAPEDKKIKGALAGALGGAGGSAAGGVLRHGYDRWIPQSFWDRHMGRITNTWMNAIPEIAAGVAGAGASIGAYKALGGGKEEKRPVGKYAGITGYAGNQASRLFSKTVGKTLKHNPMRMGPKNRIGLSALNKTKMNFKTKPPTGL